MNKTLKRRTFLIKSSRAGMTCCAMMFTSGLVASSGKFFSGNEEKPDLKKLTYCGFECTKDCEFLKASFENDPELKKEVYEKWSIKERYNIDFDAEKIFCFGCKPGDKPLGVVVENCTVRECTIEKGFDCCIECSELTGCEKDLWTRFPDFKNHVIELQKKYQAS
jgi:hypothetical protein